MGAMRQSRPDHQLHLKRRHLPALPLLAPGRLLQAQVAPSRREVERYVGLPEAAWRGDVVAQGRLLQLGASARLVTRR